MTVRNLIVELLSMPLDADVTTAICCNGEHTYGNYFTVVDYDDGTVGIVGVK